MNPATLELLELERQYRTGNLTFEPGYNFGMLLRDVAALSKGHGLQVEPLREGASR